MTQQRPEMPREPMPKSLRPAWIFIGLMIAVMIIMGIVAAIIALQFQ
jgi:type II secretory pathway pseudopilin PulG